MIVAKTPLVLLLLVVMMVMMMMMMMMMIMMMTMMMMMMMMMMMQWNNFKEHGWIGHIHPPIHSSIHPYDHNKIKSNNVFFVFMRYGVLHSDYPHICDWWRAILVCLVQFSNPQVSSTVCNKTIKKQCIMRFELLIAIFPCALPIWHLTRNSTIILITSSQKVDECTVINPCLLQRLFLKLDEQRFKSFEWPLGWKNCL